MTEAGFRAYLRPHLEAGRPFIAYWHPRGYGLCQTGLIPTRAWHYVLHQPGRPDKDYRTDYMRCRNMQMKTPGAYMEKVPVEGKPRQVSARTVAKWRVSLARQSRDWRTTRFVVVEFDGKNVSIEGGFEL